jgi:hypothetical protein
MTEYFHAIVRDAEMWIVPDAGALLDEGFLQAGIARPQRDALAAITGTDAVTAPEQRDALMRVFADPALRDALRASVWCSPPGFGAMGGDLAGEVLRAIADDGVELAALRTLDHAFVAHALTHDEPVRLWRVTVEAVELQGPVPDEHDALWQRAFCAQLAAEAIEDGHPTRGRIPRLLGGNELYDLQERDGIAVVWSARTVGQRSIPIGDPAFQRQEHGDPLVAGLLNPGWEPGDVLAARSYTFTLHPSWTAAFPTTSFGSIACANTAAGWPLFT